MNYDIYSYSGRSERAGAEILAAFARKGVSGVEFAALVGVKHPTFAAWVQACRRQRGEAGTRRRPVVRFVEAAVPTPEASAPLELELPGGVRLRLADPTQVPLVVEPLRCLRPIGPDPVPSPAPSPHRCHSFALSHLCTQPGLPVTLTVWSQLWQATGRLLEGGHLT